MKAVAYRLATSLSDGLIIDWRRRGLGAKLCCFIAESNPARSSFGECSADQVYQY